MILTMGGMVGIPVRDWLGHQMAAYVEFVIATPIVFWAAQPFFKRGWDSIRNVSPNMWTLISLGVGAAYIYSLFATFLPGVFPEQYRSARRGRYLFRSFGCHRRLDFRWSGARAACP